jgi:phosphoglycerol transferase MdoB-like AlkP superfamily enzyme
MSSGIIRMRQPLSSPGSHRLALVFKQTTAESRWAWTLFFTLLTYGVLYRLRLILQLFLDSDRVYQLAPSFSNFVLIGMQVWREAALAGVLTLALVLPWRYWQEKSGFVLPAWAEKLGFVGMLALPFLVALWYSAHLRLMFTMSTGVTLNVLQESKAAMSWIGFYKQTFLLDYLSLAAIFVLFALFWRLFRQPQRWIRSALIGGGYTLLAINVLGLVIAGNPSSPLVRDNPILFSLDNFGTSRSKKSRVTTASSKQSGAFFDDQCEPDSGRKTTVATKKKPVSSAKPAARKVFSKVQGMLDNTKRPDKRNRLLAMQQKNSVKLVGRSFLRSMPPGLAAKLPPRKDGKKWNVLQIVLESTGARYVFDTSRGNRVPMPFLQQLKKKSLYLNNHYSTANSSPRAVFSIFSGLYPIPRVKMFSLSGTNRLPSMATFVGPEYNRFLITPGAVKWYFPKWFLRRSGLRRMEGYFSLPPMKYGPSPKEGRNELDVTDYFNRQLAKARKPFFATYISFAPHYPYFDYGKKYRILPNRRTRLHRYMNTLVVLDEALRRIFATLKKTGLHDNTIVMMVGDHSEAFGQHYRNWIHSRFSYNENLRVPALFYQPKLFKPRVVNEPTSHVDLLPTLLDAMRIKYNPLLLQGESLLRGPLQRKYIFAYGNEDTVTAIDRKGRKLQMDFANRRCWWFDLKSDPKEKRKKSCRSQRLQRRAALRFWKWQPRILFQYNRSWRRTRSFRSLAHQSIPARRRSN